MRAGRKPKKNKAQAGGAQQMAQMQMIQDKMAEVQEEINQMEQSASSGGGAVNVTVSGSKEIKEIKIEPEVVDPDDIEMLQDLIMTAANEALRKMEEVSEAKMNEVSSSLGLPPGLM